MPTTTPRRRVAAIDERNVVRAYNSEVRWRIRQGSPEGYVKAAEAINESTADVVCIQHEFGLYGLWRDESWEGDRWIEGNYEDHLTPFLEALRKPALVTLHTVLPQPTPAVREAVRDIAEASDGLVVMAETAVDILRDVYGVTEAATVIPHGMPHIEPTGRRKMKAKLGLEGRSIIATFGLVGQGKGLEYVIEAMPAVVAEHPEALYLIAGPDASRAPPPARRGVPEQAGRDRRGPGDERQRRLREPVPQAEGHHRAAARERRLRHAVPRPEPDHERHACRYALGAGKAVVSTPYLHAKEALADERGILVDFRSPEQLTEAFNAILGDHELKQRLETNAYTYANEATWPKTGARMVEALRELALAAPSPTRRARGAAEAEAPPIARRLPENPLITPDDVLPSQAGFEVISTINAGVARTDGEIVLLLRVTERPVHGADLVEGAQMIDLTGPEPKLAPLPARHEGRERDRHGVRRHGAAPGEDDHRLRAARPPGPRPLRPAHDPLPQQPGRVHAGPRGVHRLPLAHLPPAGGTQHRRRQLRDRSRTPRSCRRASSRSTGSKTPGSR